jgi:membrane protein implicated in regulation of membrane protease activity
MRAVQAVLREIAGLFVDDGSLAALILLWLAVVWLVLPRLEIVAQWRGPIMVAGLLVLLVLSAWRFARKRTTKS